MNKTDTGEAAFWILLIIMALIIGFTNSCENPISDNYNISVDPRLDQDSSGYFHLTLDRNSWQTIHRFTGQVYHDGTAVENVRVEWESDKNWILSDTIGYISTYSYTSDLIYIAIDTSYIYFGQEQFIVPIINPVSYSNADGEFNIMFAPVLSQRGDTATVFMNSLDNGLQFKVVLD